MGISRWALGFLVFFVTQCVYLATLNPAFRNDDSAETIAAGMTLGLQHPPGYALAALLGRLQCLLPLGGPAFGASWQASLWASLGAVLLAYFLWDLLRQMSKGIPRWVPFFGALWGALGLAFSPTYWQHALGAKGGVYELSLCFQLGVLWTWVRAEEMEEHRRFIVLFMTFFLFGVSLADHWESSVIFLPAGFLYLFRKGFFDRRDWIRGLVFSVIGCSPLLFLPLRARLDPLLNLGDPERLAYFWSDLTRSYYAPSQASLISLAHQGLTGNLSGDWASAWWTLSRQQAAFFTEHCLENFGGWLIPLALAGFVYGWARGQKGLMVFLGFSFVSLTGALFAFWSWPMSQAWIAEKFFLPLHWIFFGLAALGAVYALIWTRERSKIALVGLLVFLAGALTLNTIPNFQRFDQSRELSIHDYGVDILRSLPRGTLFFAEGDPDYFPLYYLQLVEHLRPDVVMIPTFILYEPWGVAQVEREHPELGLTASGTAFPDHFARIIDATLELVVKNRDKRPIAFSGFNGPFHWYYLNSQKGLRIRLSGVANLLERPLLKSFRGPPLDQLRARGWNQGFTPSDSYLNDFRQVYGWLGKRTDL